MTDKNRQWVELVAHLTALTQKGELKWHLKPGAPEIASAIGATFYTSYKDRDLRLSKRKAYGAGFTLDPYSSSGSTGPFGLSRFEFDEVVLEVVDEKGYPIWRFPDVVGLDDLYSAAQRQVARVDSIIRDFLE